MGTDTPNAVSDLRNDLGQQAQRIGAYELAQNALLGADWTDAQRAQYETALYGQELTSHQSDLETQMLTQLDQQAILQFPADEFPGLGDDELNRQRRDWANGELVNRLQVSSTGVMLGMC